MKTSLSVLLVFVDSLRRCGRSGSRSRHAASRAPPTESPTSSAPAPKTADGKPDFSGLWRIDSGAYGGNLVADLKPAEVQPWADKLYKQRMENLGKDDPATFKCLPQGPRADARLRRMGEDHPDAGSWSSSSTRT